MKQTVILLIEDNPIDTKLIPDNSILLEFLGGSIFTDFKIWSNKNSSGIS